MSEFATTIMPTTWMCPVSTGSTIDGGVGLAVVGKTAIAVGRQSMQFIDLDKQPGPEVVATVDIATENSLARRQRSNAAWSNGPTATVPINTARQTASRPRVACVCAHRRAA